METAFQLRRRLFKGQSRRLNTPSYSALSLTLLAAIFAVAVIVAVLPSATFIVGKWLAILEDDASSCLIKGDIGLSGERLYYLPEQPNYDETMIQARRGERWFCSENEAQLQGWRRSSG